MNAIRGKLGTILLAFWLIFTGLVELFHLTMDALPFILGLLALAAGICLLVGW